MGTIVIVIQACLILGIAIVGILNMKRKVLLMVILSVFAVGLTAYIAEQDNKYKDKLEKYLESCSERLDQPQQEIFQKELEGAGIFLGQ